MKTKKIIGIILLPVLIAAIPCFAANKLPGKKANNQKAVSGLVQYIETKIGFQSQSERDELDSTYRWFRNNPPKADGSNFQSRWGKTALLDKYGWQVSNDTWSLYRSFWVKDPIKAADFENSNPILYYIRQAFDKSVNEITNAKIKHGVIIWKLYNMGYIVKTKDACFAIDLVQSGSNQLVDILDFTIVSHIHSDHNNKDFLNAMVKAGKKVYSPFYDQGTVINSTNEFHFGEVNIRFTMNMQANIPVIVSQINCGPSADNYTIYDIADARLLAELNPTTHVNLLILHVANGINIFETVDKIKPDATIYDHVMELGHAIDNSRWSYNYTYNKIQNQPHASSYVLTCGERLDIGVTK